MRFINYLETMDHKIILLLNGNNYAFLDQLMWTVSQPVFGLPFYILFIYLFFKNITSRTLSKLQSLIGITVGIGDLVAHELIKETVQRYRPSHHLELSKQLKFVHNYRGGMFGFVSNHATNMSIVGVMVFMFKKYYPKSWIYLSVLVLTISFSRIYLGVHYLSDIIGGWILGIILSFSNYQLIKKTILKS